MTATLLARDLTLSFGDHLVLDAVDVGLAARDRVGVVGPNGTGKTTLLRVLAGLQQPDRGSVSLAPPSATVGYLPQEPERRAGESVRAFFARRTGVTAAAAELDAATLTIEADHDRYDVALARWLALGGADLDARIGPVWAGLGLDDRLLDQDTTTLSGGQAARPWARSSSPSSTCSCSTSRRTISTSTASSASSASSTASRARQ
jgi:ATPase subunit of ABC transporter with duplicated ATPase domains